MPFFLTIHRLPPAPAEGAVVLKPLRGPYVGLILGGALIAWLGIPALITIGLDAGLIFWGLGGLGLLAIAAGVVGLVRRKKYSLSIESAGITVPSRSFFRAPNATGLALGALHIPRGAMESISAEASIRGRLIVIALREGGLKATIDARRYCSQKVFLAHCKSQGLPTA